MGYYVNTDSKGRELGRLKKESLINDGAIIVTGNEYLENLLCVVDNGMFEAVGYCFSEDEYLDFKNPDNRKRTWLVHPLAKELSGFKK